MSGKPFFYKNKEQKRRGKRLRKGPQALTLAKLRIYLKTNILKTIHADIPPRKPWYSSKDIYILV